MNRDDWLYVGCKILGVYFGVSGILSIVSVIAITVYTAVNQADNTMGIWDGQFPFLWTSFVDPIVRIFFAYILIWRTCGCVRFLKPKREEVAESPMDKS
jgi:hypothetical protein